MNNYEFRDGHCYYNGDGFKWPSYEFVVEKNGRRSVLNLNWQWTHQECEMMYKKYKGKLLSPRSEGLWLASPDAGRIIKIETIEEWCKLL